MKHLITLLMVLAFSIHLIAQPTTITWQGKLLDAGGNSITQSNVAMTFAMFDAETGGNQLWPASGVVAKVVNVVNGLYSVQLGTGTGDDLAFTASMFDGITPWLEVKVGTETLPRTEITNVPFALISNDLSASGWENPGEIGKTTPNIGKFTSLETENLKMTTGAADGKILTSDAGGNASWEFMSIVETDPVFGASAAKGITSADITNWNNKISSQWTTSGSDIYYNTGNVGIGVSSPHAPLQLSNDAANRKIVLYESENSDHRFYGFGINGYALRYQVDGTDASHVFYAGSTLTSSNELFRIKGTGEIVIPAFTSPGIVLNNASGTLSSTKGAAYQVLRMNDAGTATQWSYMVASVSGSSPIISNGGINPMISILPASSTSAGSMSATDKAKLDKYPEGTVAGQMQYWDGSAWVTVSPGTWGQILEFRNGAPVWVDKNANSLVIGDAYKGGIVAYILQPNDPGYDPAIVHGIIAAPADQSAGASWGCPDVHIPGTNGYDLGTGAENTLNIVAGCSTAGIAARICNDLVLNGYSDWHLPSISELVVLYLNRNAIGGFTNVIYWSSSELGPTYAYAHDFNLGMANTYTKNQIYRVRAVRYF